MPLRKDLKSVLLIGSGPIVIGQACEFDYSGTQAVKALREEGLKLVLVNSNPATIMTDPELADRTYIEPMTAAVLTKIIERERPDAILPTVGGQTALNLAIELAEAGTLDRFKCELIGAKLGAIKKAEDRDLFKQAMLKIGLEVPRSAIARSAADGERVLGELGLPVIIRPSRTLGGTGGSIARELDDYRAKVAYGLEQSPSHEVLIEQSVEGWKEFELEVMRDTADNVVIICSIENLDPMGVHTGDSITVAPAQTLTDKEYQIMRDAAIRIIREIGVDTGGSNIQFAIEPTTGRMVVIEMNPRVSRSSALASKATGFPIAKIAARLAVGYRLDEIPNDITRMTPSCFEPTIDYVVTKIPRFAFEKFRGAADELGPQMKSVGEAMAIGRTFKESLQKALRSLEIGSHGLESGLPEPPSAHAAAQIRAQLAIASSHRLYHLADALRLGITRAEAYQLSKIDPWFIDAVAELVAEEKRVAREPLGAAYFREFKPMGFSDRRIADLRGIDEAAVASARREAGVTPVFKSVDTCGAEFEAFTPYLYSTYEGEDEAPPTARKKVIILGGGPNRIGQGIEFDYCCVHASMALKEGGFETIMVNCNPETVSTDYDISDRLYFEPLTFEDVMAIAEREKPVGVIVQFGGQTPLKLAVPLERAGVPILGTSPDAIDRAEDRERFNAMVARLGLRQPDGVLARGLDDAIAGASKVGYPVLIRPSYVLGGRAMEVIPNEEELRRYVTQALQASERHPLLIDRYLQGAIEVDVDAIADGETVVVGGIMEHVEHAGIHSGDSACAIPPTTLSAAIQQELDRADQNAGARTRRDRADQYSVRDLWRRSFYPGSQSARVAHDSVRQQGDRRASGEVCRAGDGGKEAQRDWVHDATRADSRRGQGVGVSVRAIPGCRYDSGTGDEIDRRSDGNRHDVRDGVCQGGVGGVVESTRRRAGVHQCPRRRQAIPRADSARAGGDGIRSDRDARDRQSYSKSRTQVRTRQQGARRQPAYSGRDEGWARRDGRQHSRRERHEGFVLDTAHRAGTSAAVFHDDGRGKGSGGRNLRAEARTLRGARAAGLPSRVKRR